MKENRGEVTGIAIGALLVVLLVAACQRKDNGKSEASPEELTGKWKLTAVDSQHLVHDTKREVFIVMDYGQNVISGYTGCNSFSGRLHATAFGFRVSETIATQKGCEGDLEMEFFEHLDRTVTYDIVNDTLHLSSSKGEDMLSFTRLAQ